MILKTARIFVTDHAIERYRERLGVNLAPEALQDLCRKAKRVAISVRRRYRLRWSGPDNQRATWLRYKDAFLLLRSDRDHDDCYKLVTVLSVVSTGKEAKLRRKALDAAGRKRKR